MNLHAQLNSWLNRPVRIGFEETPPLDGRLVAVHVDYLTLVHRDRLLHCPLRHVGSLKRKLSAAALTPSAEIEMELAALPATFEGWLGGAAGAQVEFNAGAPRQESGRLVDYDGCGFTLEEEGESANHAAALIRWIGKR